MYCFCDMQNWIKNDKGETSYQLISIYELLYASFNPLYSHFI